MRTILLACCALACHAAPIHVGGSIGPAGITLQGVGDDSWFSLTGTMSITDVYDQFNPMFPYTPLYLIGVTLRPGTICWPNCVPYVNGTLTTLRNSITLAIASQCQPFTAFCSTFVTPPTYTLSLYADYYERPDVGSPLTLGTVVPEPGTMLTALLPLVALRLAGWSRTIQRHSRG